MQPAPAAPPGRLDRFALAQGNLLAWLFVAAAAITVWEVLMRYVLNAPTTWVHVTTTTLCAVGFCAGGPYAMARDEHVRITSVYDRFPAGLRRGCDLLALACGALYLAGLGYAAVLQAWEASWRFEGVRWVPEPVPGPPHWPLPAILRVALALGVLLFLLMVLQRLVRLLRRRGPAPGRESH